MVKSKPLSKQQQTMEGSNDMNKRFLVLMISGAIFATSIAAGCAAHKRDKPASVDPVILSTSATTRPAITETTVQKVVTVYREATRPTETETEATTTTTTTTATPTATPKPTAKPTKKPTAKPTKKPTAKPTKKPTTKPTVKKTSEPTKTNTLMAVSREGTDPAQITGIYHGAWSDITVDGTDLQHVKITATIHDSEDSSKVSVWKMDGKYNPSNGAVIYSNCTKTSYVYDGNNNVASKNTVYSNGQGKIVIRNGMINWNDYQEHAADDMTFISASRHDHRG